MTSNPSPTPKTRHAGAGRSPPAQLRRPHKLRYQQKQIYVTLPSLPIFRSNINDNKSPEVHLAKGLVMLSTAMKEGANQRDNQSNKRSYLVVLLGGFTYLAALVCIIFVPVWKIIDTSYLFRERDDPSLYDNVKDFFSSENSNWPFSQMIDSGKDTYRVYFFIIPFVIGFGFIGLYGKILDRTKTPLHRKTKLPTTITGFLGRRISVFNCTVMDLIFISTMLIYSAILLWARTKRSLSRGAKKLTYLYQDSADPLPPLSWECAEIMAKTLGVLTITLMGWFVLLPISRRSVLLDVLGAPWEVAVKFHRWLGWYTLAVLLAHTLVYIEVWIYANGNPLYDQDGNLLRHMVVPGSCNDGLCDEDTETLHFEMMFGYCALLILIIMAVLSLNYIRRHYYEIFYYAHQLFVLLILFTCFHYAKTMLYLIPGVVMLVIDKTIGCLSMIGSTSARSRCLNREYFELIVEREPKTAFKSGQYVFVNVPDISVWEWHPMTVAWATKDEIAIHIRSRGPRTWTQKVYEAIRSGEGYISIKLDGFYGRDMIETYDLKRRDALLFVAGGGGLPMFMSIITELGRIKASVPVYLHWVVRKKEEYAAFEKLLRQLASSFDSSLSVSVWITLSRGNSADGPGWFKPASIPLSALQSSDEASGTESGDSINIKYGGTRSHPWRPYPTWLWPSYGHAFITAIAIFIGCGGYALSRQYEVEPTGGLGLTELGAILVDRFLDYFIVISFTFLFVVALFVTVARCWPSEDDTIVRRDQDDAVTNNSRTESTETCHGSDNNSNNVSSRTTIESQNDSTGGSDIDVDLETFHIGSGSSLGNPVAVRTGCRPNIKAIFNEVHEKHPQNVCVMACGPDALVGSVKDQHQSYLRQGWLMPYEEWEW